MKKMESLLEDLQKANERLKEMEKYPDEQVYQDAAIQRFEFTFELSWKLMQAIAVKNGFTTYGPRNAIRNAAQLGLVNDVDEWFKYLEFRNLTTHTYEEAVAEKVYQGIKGFDGLVVELIGAVDGLQDE